MCILNTKINYILHLRRLVVEVESLPFFRVTNSVNGIKFTDNRFILTKFGLGEVLDFTHEKCYMKYILPCTVFVFHRRVPRKPSFSFFIYFIFHFRLINDSFPLFLTTTMYSYIKVLRLMISYVFVYDLRHCMRTHS